MSPPSRLTSSPVNPRRFFGPPSCCPVMMSPIYKVSLAEPEPATYPSARRVPSLLWGNFTPVALTSRSRLPDVSNTSNVASVPTSALMPVHAPFLFLPTRTPCPVMLMTASALLYESVMSRRLKFLTSTLTVQAFVARITGTTRSMYLPAGMVSTMSTCIQSNVESNSTDGYPPLHVPSFNRQLICNVAPDAFE